MDCGQHVAAGVITRPDRPHRARADPKQVFDVSRMNHGHVVDDNEVMASGEHAIDDRRSEVSDFHDDFEVLIVCRCCGPLREAIEEFASSRFLGRFNVCVPVQHVLETRRSRDDAKQRQCCTVAACEVEDSGERLRVMAAVGRAVQDLPKRDHWFWRLRRRLRCRGSIMPRGVSARQG